MDRVRSNHGFLKCHLCSWLRPSCGWVSRCICMFDCTFIFWIELKYMALFSPVFLVAMWDHVHHKSFDDDDDVSPWNYEQDVRYSCWMRDWFGCRTCLTRPGEELIIKEGCIASLAGSNFKEAVAVPALSTRVRMFMGVPTEKRNRVFVSYRAQIATLDSYPSPVVLIFILFFLLPSIFYTLLIVFFFFFLYFLMFHY